MNANISKVDGLLGRLIGLFFFVAAVLKLANFDEFESAIRTWTLVPDLVGEIAVVALPPFELVMGLSLLLRPRTIGWNVAAAVFIVGVSVLYYFQIQIAEPKCGCLGAIQRWIAQKHEVMFFVLRNTFIASCIGVNLILISRGRWSLLPPKATVSNEVRSSSRQGAFTLIELLVVIAVVAILIFITAVGIRDMRERARSLKSIVQLRSHAAVLSVYAGDYKDELPFFLDVDQRTEIVIDGKVAKLRFFDSYWAWCSWLGPRYYPGGSRDASFRGPERAGLRGQNSYYYSATMVTRPEFWQADTRVGPEQWSGVQLSEIRVPYLKALVTNHGQRIVNSRAELLMAMGDGGVFESYNRKAASQLLVRPFTKGDGNYPQSALGKPGIVGLHTVSGIWGRDVSAR